MNRIIKELVIATRNKGKFREFSFLLKDEFEKIYSLNDFDSLPEIRETGETFSENAYLKASVTASSLNKPVLADDSGLVVNSLGGEPGVFSARYAGPDATDSQNIEKLLLKLGDSNNRTASFVCSLCLIIPGHDPVEAEGRCDGIITKERKGNAGFGYDPVFYVPELNKTMAELSDSQKNSISHRYRAIQELRKKINSIQR